jgi:xylulokinase
MENGDASFGAALLAGIGTGVFASPADAITTCVRPLSRHEPNAANHKIYLPLFDIYKSAQSVLAPLNHQINASQT